METPNSQTAQQPIQTAADREREQLAASESGLASSQVAQSREAEFNPSSDQTATGGDTGGSSGVTNLPTSPAAAADEWTSVLDYAGQFGMDVSGYADDRALLTSLIQQAAANRQADYYAQLGRQLAPHQEQIRQYIGQQQNPAPAGPQAWEAPNFDKRWLALVDYDPAAGMYVGKNGAVPPSIVEGVNKYHAWREKFDVNPMQAVQPWVEQHVPTLIEKQVQAGIERYKREQTVNSIVSEHANWLYQQDQHGNPLVGPGGRMVPTPNGMRYGQLISELERSGVSDPRVADRYARAQLLAELGIAQQRQQAQAAPAQQTANAVASARSQQNVRQSQGLAHAPANEPPPEQTGMSLSEMLRQNLHQAGFGTDESFAFDQM